MKNQKVLLVSVIVISVIAFCLAILSFFNYVNIDIMRIFVGLALLFSGISQMNVARQLNSKRNKIAGIISIIIGITTIILSITKMITR
ncbi:hypothetical protein [Ectobacillus polymachus]|uniref:hypothetical protein n=1 Tax=Ectobacillus polymachus TaxID=1508806 RepID=UPI003A8ABC27